jgi:hypothetical protein
MSRDVVIFQVLSLRNFSAVSRIFSSSDFRDISKTSSGTIFLEDSVVPGGHAEANVLPREGEGDSGGYVRCWERGHV